MATGDGQIKKSIGEAADVAAPQSTSGTVQRQIAAASTGKVGSDLGGAQTDAATSATINTVQGKLAAGKAAALNRAKGIKQKRDGVKQQGEAQRNQLESQRKSMKASSEQQSQDIYARLNEAGKDMSLKDKMAAGEQLDFLKQMEHTETENNFRRIRQARRNMTQQERRKSNAQLGAAQALEDAIQETKFAMAEAKKSRDYAEANLLADQMKQHQADLDKINDNANALMTSALGSAAKAGVAYGDTETGTGENKKKNWDRPLIGTT